MFTPTPAQSQSIPAQPTVANQVLCAYCGRPASGVDIAAGRCRHCDAFLLGDADLHRFFGPLIRALKYDEPRSRQP